MQILINAQGNHTENTNLTIDDIHSNKDLIRLQIKQNGGHAILTCNKDELVNALKAFGGSGSVKKEKKPILNRRGLIEWMEEYINMIPPHCTVAMTFAKPLDKQETHILRKAKEMYEDWQSRAN